MFPKDKILCHQTEPVPESQIRELLRALFISALDSPREGFKLEYAEECKYVLSKLSGHVFRIFSKTRNKDSLLLEYIFVTFMANKLSVQLPKRLHKVFRSLLQAKEKSTVKLSIQIIMHKVFRSLSQAQEKIINVKKYKRQFILLISIALIVRLVLDFLPITNIFPTIPSWKKDLFWGLFSGFLAICILLILKSLALKLYHFAEDVFIKSNIKKPTINEIVKKLENEKRSEIEKEDVNKYVNVVLEKFKASMKPEIKNFITMKEAFIICFLGTFLVVCVLGVMGVLAWISMYISLHAFLLVIAGGSVIIIIIFLSLGFYIGKLTEKGFLNGIIETLKLLRFFKINMFRKKPSEEDETNILGK